MRSGLPTLQPDNMSKKKPSIVEFEIPLLLRSKAFFEAWEMFVAHRKEKKKPVTPTSAKLILKKLESWGEKRAVAAIEYSVEKGWQGIFEPTGQQQETRTTVSKIGRAGW